jgi:HK97 family phage portal protein
VSMLYDPSGRPVEIAAGRGDLRYGSIPGSINLGPGGLTLTGDRPISYARLFGSQPYVAAAVMRMLWWAVRVPLKCYRKTSDDSVDRIAPADHPLADAITNPWQVGPAPPSQAALIQSILGPLLVNGNSLTVIDQGASNRIRFDPVDWRFTIPIAGLGNLIAGWTVTQTGDAERFGADVAMHTAWWSALGPLGTSPLQQLGVTLQIEDAAQRYQRAMFRNGARPPSAITASEAFLSLGEEEREALLDQLRDDVDDIYSGPDNAGRPALLPPGLDWKQVGHTAVEAELINQRRVAREEICAVYQIPPPMLGILDRATFSNIEVQREMAYTDSLAPPLVLIEQTLNAHLVRGLLGESDVFLEFDFAGVLRGDKLKEIQALREAIGMGLLTPNEGRGVLNYSRFRHALADELWMPSNNLTPLSQTKDDSGGGDSADAADSAASSDATGADLPAAPDAVPA